MGLSCTWYQVVVPSVLALRGTKTVARVWLTRSHFVTQGALGKLAGGSCGSSDSASSSQEVGGGPQLHTGLLDARGELR